MSEEEKQITIFREKFPHLYDLYIDRKESGSFSEGENLEQQLRQAFKAIREEEDKNKIRILETHAWELRRLIGMFQLNRIGEIKREAQTFLKSTQNSIKSLALKTDKENI